MKITTVRMIPNNNIYKGIQYNGSNTLEIIDFCKFCYTVNNKLIYLNKEVDKEDWIIKITNDDFILINDIVKNLMFN